MEMIKFDGSFEMANRLFGTDYGTDWQFTTKAFKKFPEKATMGEVRGEIKAGKRVIKIGDLVKNSPRKQFSGSFNINDHVLVKLTTTGKACWKKNHESFSMPDDSFEKLFKEKTDENGWTRFQMHVLFNIFGPQLGAAANGGPFARNEIRFDRRTIHQFRNHKSK